MSIWRVKPMAALVSTCAGAMISVLAGIGSSSAMTYRDNIVDMPVSAKSYTNVTATYTIDSFSITSGQDPDGHIYAGYSDTYTGNKGSMKFVIGQKTSKEVATWFSSKIKSNQNTFDDKPKDLNFAFLGTLKLTLTGGVLNGNQDTYTLSNISFAQGSTFGFKNWWFGGQSCTYNKNSTVKCAALSSAGYTVYFYFKRGGNNDHEVKLTEIDYPEYQTFPLLSKYVGENVACKWQPSSVCPPYVMYYSRTTDGQTGALKLFVSKGKLYNQVGSLFDTSGADPSHSGPAAIFVMGSDGGIYASNANKVFLFHHSTILAGTAVASAGELQAKQGVITLMTNCSGHYSPTWPAAYTQFLESLHRNGYTAAFATRICQPGDVKY